VATRLIARNSISLTFTMPMVLPREDPRGAGRDRRERLDWFGASTRSRRTSSPSCGDATDVLPMYPEFIFDPAEYQAFCATGAPPSGASSRTCMAFKSATRFRSERDLPRQLGVSRCGDLRGQRTRPRSRVSLLHFDYLTRYQEVFRGVPTGRGVVRRHQ